MAVESQGHRSPQPSIPLEVPVKRVFAILLSLALLPPVPVSAQAAAPPTTPAKAEKKAEAKPAAKPEAPKAVKEKPADPGSGAGLFSTREQPLSTRPRRTIEKTRCHRQRVSFISGLIILCRSA